MWVFGYGSLIWKVDFPYERRVVGYIKGYVRRFYQHSIDHRGVPEMPGRVVTLLPAPDDETVWGVAYKIKDEDKENVLDHLDFREKNGYTKEKVLFHPVGGKGCHKDHGEDPFQLTIYVATPNNVSFAGEADIDEIARQVVLSVGPSGSNKEYVYQLASAMRLIAPGIMDDHLFSLEKAVKILENNNSSEKKF